MITLVGIPALEDILSVQPGPQLCLSDHRRARAAGRAWASSPPGQCCLLIVSSLSKPERCFGCWFYYQGTLLLLQAICHAKNLGSLTSMPTSKRRQFPAWPGASERRPWGTGFERARNLNCISMPTRLLPRGQRGGAGFCNCFADICTPLLSLFPF